MRNKQGLLVAVAVLSADAECVSEIRGSTFIPFYSIADL